MFRFIFADLMVLSGGILSADPIRITITQGVIELPTSVVLALYIYRPL